MEVKTVQRTPDRPEALWEQAEAEETFWQEHHHEFIKKYPDQFVAVRGGAVVAVASNLRALVSELRARGLSPADVWVRFIAATRRAILL